MGGSTPSSTVTDPSGAAVPGAKATLSNSATGFTRSTETNFTARRTGIPLSVELQVGATQETVTVTEEVPVVETTRSQSSSTVDQKSVSDLPINGRNFIGFTVLTPGVVKDPTRGGDLAFGGQRGPNNFLLVDGTDSNNLFYGQATGRNLVRGPEFATVDARLSKDVPLMHERMRLRLMAEAFNVTNRANFNGTQTTRYTYSGGFFRPATNFMATQTVFDPRIFQLAVRIVF